MKLVFNLKLITQNSEDKTLFIYNFDIFPQQKLM